MFELDHSMALMMTHQNELMAMVDVLDLERPCEWWDTYAGSVAVGALNTMALSLLACLVYYGLLRRANREVINRVNYLVYKLYRMQKTSNRDDGPPSYESVSCSV